MRLILFITLLFELAVSCKSKTTEKSNPIVANKPNSNLISNIYISVENHKCRFILNEDMTFNYISIKENDILRLDYFTTNGSWKNLGDTIILESRNDSIDHKPAIMTYDTINNNGYSIFNFSDIYQDSIASWEVLYPDGKRMSNGTTDQGAAIYQWEENMKKNKFVEFDFSGYPNFRYFPPDSNVYKVNIKLLPKYIPDYFKNTILIRKNDTLIWNTKSESRFFVRLK